MKILIVDDELVSRRKLERLITVLGYKTLVANDGIEGWKIWEDNRPEMVITDWIMPGIDGLDLCRKIRDSEGSQYTFIIMVTSKEDVHDIVTGMDAGADDFITKPFAKEDLAVRIRAGERMLDFESRLIKARNDLTAEIEERKQVEKKLARHRDRLEEIVKERTLELTEANKQLELDLAERIRAGEEKSGLEKQLRQAQKMEAIGTLAGGIAHDFNNILFPILGYTEMTMEDVPEDSIARRNMEQVYIAANRAKELVHQILAFSRQQEQERKPLKIQPIIKEAIKFLRASLPSTIDITQNIDNECGPMLADPIEIYQVIMNLCTNAYHAMCENGGVLGVTLTETDIGFSDLAAGLDLNPGPYMRLTVNDTGHGIKPAVVERIFEPYFTTKAPGEGTGLGLSVLHGIVTSCGGHITVYSEPDKGTAFHVYFPLIDTGATAQETLTAEAPPKGNEHILLVDDEEQIVRMVQQMLERLGYSVSARTSSVEALDAFRVQPKEFDLVITDQIMPNMTGLKLAQKLIAARPDIPIILCTGFSEVITEEKAKAIGIKAYVMKPVVKNDIARIIRKVLDQ